jgi:hypothetical protein
MVIIRDFDISVNKDKVYSAITSYYPLPDEKEFDLLYNSSVELAHSVVKPLGAFKLDKMSTIKPSNLFNFCNEIIYCFFTIGNEITEIIDKLFEENKFTNAIILDAISTLILFEMSKQFNNRIYEYTSLRNLGLTCRIAPGDGEIDITYQKNIIESFDDHEALGIEVIHDYIIKPYKSLTYVFGADKNIAINNEDHKCEHCHNLKCFMRNSNERIRGPFYNPF